MHLHWKKNIPGFFINGQNLLNDVTVKDIELLHDTLSNSLQSLPQKMLKFYNYGSFVNIPPSGVSFVDQLLYKKHLLFDRSDFRWCGFTYPAHGRLLEKIAAGSLSSKDVNMVLSVIIYTDILSGIGSNIIMHDFNHHKSLNLSLYESLESRFIKIWRLLGNLFSSDFNELILSELLRQLHISYRTTVEDVRDIQTFWLSKVREMSDDMNFNQMDLGLCNKADDTICRKVVDSLMCELPLETEEFEGLTKDETKILQLISGELDTRIEDITKICQLVSGELDHVTDDKTEEFREKIAAEKRNYLAKELTFMENWKDYWQFSSDFIDHKDRAGLVSSITKLKRDLANCDCDMLIKLDNAFEMFILKATHFLETGFVKCFEESLSFDDVFPYILYQRCSPITEDLKQMYQYGFQKHKFGLPSLRNYISYKCQHTINQRAYCRLRVRDTDELGLSEVWSYWVTTDGGYKLVDKPQNIVLI